MNEAVSVRIDGRVAFVAIDNPPVNGLGVLVRAGLFEAFTALRRDAAIDGVVLHGIGRAFSAGGDIREFGTPAASAAPGLSKHVHPAIETCGKVVVAAVHGYALGGGLETAMACHYRVATADARIGLPEARIGVIPLSGTQRLPRLVGVDAAIDMILHARELSAKDAPAALINAIAAENDLLDVAAALARRRKPSLARDLAYPANAGAALARARVALAAGDYSPFSTHLLDAMECAIGVSFDEGLERARTIYDAVVDTPQSSVARQAFLQSRAAASRNQA